ncbi:MAG: methyltransferase domain-containing protein [Candidatus Omnitrophota bacterium]
MDKQTEDELTQIAKKNYEEIASQYNETRKKHLEPLWSTLVSLAQEVKAGAKVLDVGCGNGRLLEAFGDKQINYLGIDPCKKLVNLARRQKPGFRFELGNVLKLNELEEEGFDCIFSTAVIHHLPGRGLRFKAFVGMKEKLNSEGKIIITVWNMWPQKRFRKLIFKYSVLKLLGRNKMDWGDIIFKGFNKNSDRYYHVFTKAGLKKIARCSGLTIEKLYKDEYNYYLILRK